jgi:hypothetical protein
VGIDTFFLHVHHLSGVEDDKGNRGTVSVLLSKSPKIEDRTCPL